MESKRCFGNNKRSLVLYLIYLTGMKTEITYKEYWSNYWSKFPKLQYNINNPAFYSMHLLFSMVIKEKLKKKRNDRKVSIIDVGCGNGLLLRYFSEQYKRLDIYGIEYSEVFKTAEQLKRDLYLNFKLEKLDFVKDKIDHLYRKFDIVVSVGVIEHFKNPFKPMYIMKKLLNNNGCLMTLIPNFEGLFVILWKLYDKRNYDYHIPIKHGELFELYRSLELKNIRIFRMGIPTIPGVHNRDNLFEKILGWGINQLNGRIIQKVYKMQRTLSIEYSMAPLVGCIGFKK